MRCALLKNWYEKTKLAIQIKMDYHIALKKREMKYNYAIRVLHNYPTFKFLEKGLSELCDHVLKQPKQFT